MLRYSAENICAEVSFQKIQASTLLKRDSSTGVFVSIAKVLRAASFVEHVWWFYLYFEVHFFGFLFLSGCLC